MDVSHSCIGYITKEEDICPVDSTTTHTILKNEKYFISLNKHEGNVCTISGSIKLIEGSGRAIILLPQGTKFIIDDALFFPKSKRNLLSFKDIRRNGYHIETMNREDKEFLYITSIVSGNKCVKEKLFA